ncbi:MAG TPA: DUF805 domain-containing protein [Bacteroidales bacterium]|jgi:uncharacterized membrane protein YhaH (DUF805 family)|nr:DUF805 domain-containing protein [Clostridia bacterium]HPH52880.1 DUF805 domain-containing protein [Bacteroidales bacterium]
MKWFVKCMKQYADFGGRARRTEFWMFVLFNIIFSVIASLIDRAIGFKIGAIQMGIIGLIYSLAVLIPALAVSVRRLHDIGKSGWMILINLIPFIGWIWFIVLMVKDSQPGENQYGPNPKEVTT